MKNRIKTLFVELGIVLSSVYLTFLIDVFTLNTLVKRVFVFIYFITICHVIFALSRRVVKKYNISRVVAASLVLISGGIVIVGNNIFLPTAQDMNITLTASKCEDGAYREVWLSNILVDNQELQLSHFEIDGNQGWQYIKDSDDYAFYPNENGNNENYLSFHVTAKNVDLTFAHNAWSGAVEVGVDGENTTQLQLTSTDGSNDSLGYSLHADRTYTIWERILYGAGAWIVVAFIIDLLLGILFKNNGGSLKTDRRRLVINLLMFANTGLLFFTNQRIKPTRLTQTFLIVLTAIAIYVLNSKQAWSILEKYKSRSGYAAVIAISIYASLASFGQRFFLNGNTRIHGSWQGALYCASGVLWFIPIIWIMLYVIEWLASKNYVQVNKYGRIKAKWILFAILAGCQLMVAAFMWPGGFPADAIDQLNQAVGARVLNDWHPVLHTLIERVIICIFHSAGAIVAVQMIIFAWIMAAFLMIGYDRGIRLSALCLVGVVLEFLPTQVLSGSNALKDFPYTLALLWGVYLLYQIGFISARTASVRTYLYLALDLFLIMTLRHNGLVPFAFIAITLIIIAARYHKSIGMKAIASVALSVILVTLYKGPLFQLLHVGKNTVSPYTTMLCAVGSCINKGLPLSNEADEIMAKAMPLKDWADYYNRFTGHDDYVWGRPEGSVPYDTSQISGKEAFQVYFEALKKYPDVVIKDRMDGMDLMWDVVQPEDSFNAISFDFINPVNDEIASLFNEKMDLSNGAQLYEKNWIVKIYHHTMDAPINGIADILLWRPGAYLIALFVLILYWWKNHKNRLWWAAMPIVGNIAGSVLVLYHQSFRYVYFIQLGVIALVFLTITLPKKQCMEQSSEDIKLKEGK